jgi:riboflavin kinase/FMN adenylyltransferase
MLVVQGYDSVPTEAQGAILAIGNFDGVHRGHQALVAQAVEEAKRARRPSGVLLFEPHPREFFLPDEPHFRLTSLSDKLALLEKLGIDQAIVLPFDRALAGLDPETFIARVLVGALRVSGVVIGYDFFFGKDRRGTPETMQREGARLGFTVTVIAPVAEAGEAFSSSAIRAQLAQGDVGGAAHGLGRPWTVKGRVIVGAKRGTELGFPTANIALSKGTALAHGIYAVRVATPGGRFDGAAYLGTRPMFDNGRVLLEVFLLDFAGDLYGEEIEIEFIDFIRGDRKFDSVAALKAQMEADCAEARRLLANPAAQGIDQRRPLS